MQFIQFGMLGALGALAIPIIIHLLFRQRARTVDLGTLQFLKIVLRDNARRRRLKRWLLLALRMACVALIAFLFARPYMLATEPAAGDRLVVVLLDRSASMGLQGGTPADRSRAGRGAGDPGAGRPGHATGSRHVRPGGSPTFAAEPTSTTPHSSRRPPARITAPRWPGRATSWSAPGKPSRNCISSPISSDPGSIGERP